jgi:hypothetical protein
VLKHEQLPDRAFWDAGRPPARRREWRTTSRNFNIDKTGVAALDVPGLGRETIHVTSTVSVEFGAALPKSSGCSWPTYVDYTPSRIEKILQRLSGMI